LLPQGKSADYILTGSWSQKAYKEAKTVGTARVASSTEKDKKFTRVPAQNELDLDANAAYVHITSNNTIFGSQWAEFPNVGNVPLVADMSSDIAWRPIDVSKFGLIYAGAQKNLGPSGIAVVIVRKDLVEAGRKDIPAIFQYRTHSENNSLYNTPPDLQALLDGRHVRDCLGAVRIEETEVQRQQRRGVEVGGAGALGEGAQLGVPAPRHQQLARLLRRALAAPHQIGIAGDLADLGGPARPGPMRQQGERVQVLGTAELPQSRVRLFEALVDLLEQLPHQRLCAAEPLRVGEAHVQQHATHGQDHLAIDVVLDVLVRLVADAHGLLAAVAREVRELLLDEPGLAVDAVERL
jgi:hypothetical protein